MLWKRPDIQLIGNILPSKVVPLKGQVLTMPKYDCTGMWYSILHLKWLLRQKGNIVWISNTKGRIYVAFFMLITLKFTAKQLFHRYALVSSVGRFRNLVAK